VAGEVFESVEGESDALDEALRALHRRAKRGRRAAVVAGNAVVTLRVAQAMARLGWQFGQELGFVGFDDPEWASLIGPGLSTVAQPTDAIGRCAATCLIERLQGLDVAARQLLLPGQLVVRGSSQPA
jgi:LacI family kdg operon repressor